jgi:hypothetical protein
MASSFDLHEQREMNKISLDTFSFDKDNNFDYAADIAIGHLQQSNVTAEAQINALLKQTWKDEDERLQLQLQQIHFETEIMYNNEHIYALLEMKIIYAFKDVEINTKFLLNAAYSKNTSHEFYKWERLLDFLKEKSIEAGQLKGYQPVNELRLVNNCIKHSVSIRPSTSCFQKVQVVVSRLA